MKLKKKKRVHKKAVNLPPGTISYRGKKQSQITDIDIIAYTQEQYQEFKHATIDQIFSLLGTLGVTWININGLNNAEPIEALGSKLKIHALTLEDIVNTHHRPKIDEYDKYLFMVFKMLYYKEDTLIYEQFNMVVGDNYIFTFQESDEDVFDDLRERITNSKGRIRGLGADYLMFAILDAIIDNYLVVIDAYGERIEDLENSVVEAESETITNQIQLLKHEILKVRRSIYPVKEIINRLEKTDCEFIDPKTHSYIRDLHDNMAQVTETLDLYREMVWSLMDMHMSIVSNKMNEVMKVLTIIATIFIPLTFIAGVYGMNFNNMPELQYKYGYFVVWGLMILIFIIMIFYFRRKKWL